MEDDDRAECSRPDGVEANDSESEPESGDAGLCEQGGETEDDDAERSGDADGETGSAAGGLDGVVAEADETDDPEDDTDEDDEKQRRERDGGRPTTLARAAVASCPASSAYLVDFSPYPSEPEVLSWVCT